MLVRQRTPLEVGFSLKKAFKKATRTVSRAAKVVTKVPGIKSVVKAAKKASHLPGVSHALVGYRVAYDVAKGRNVVRSVRRQVKTAIADTRKGLPVAAGVVSFVPGVGQGVASGLAAAAALSEGKSLQNIALEAALGAVPGGQIAKMATQAGYKIAKGQNVLRTVASSGLEYAGSAIGGGQLAQKAVRAGLGVVRGQNVIEAVGREVLGSSELAKRALATGARISRGENVVKAVGREAVSYARSNLPIAQTALAQRALATGGRISRGENVVRAVGREAFSYARSTLPVAQRAQKLVRTLPTQARQVMPLIRPSYGAPSSIAPEHIARVRRLVSDNRPTRARVPLSGHMPKVGFRPLSVVARNALVAAVPRMRSEVSGLSTTGTEWIVESGDTGSKIALKLTGNANRWTELKAVNPKIMSRSPDLIKKYGFPIYIGDKVILPAAWIKPTSAQTPAQTAPSTPSETKPSPTVAPAGDLAAQAQARAILAAFGKSDGASFGVLGDYGGGNELTATQWSSRDVYQATAFATYWKQKGGIPAVSDGNWSESLAQALNRWMELKAQQMTAGSGTAAGGNVPSIPTTPTAPSAEPVSTVATLAAQALARTTLAAWGRTDGATFPIVADYGGGAELTAMQWSSRDTQQAGAFATYWRQNAGVPVVSGGQWSDALAQALKRWAELKATQAQIPQGGGVVTPSGGGATATTAPAETGMNNNQKWALGSIVGGSLLGAFIRATM